MIGKLAMLACRGCRQGMRVCLAVVVLGVLAVAGHQVPGVVGDTVVAGQPAALPDAQRLVGRWVRPDGGYVLEVREVANDGSLKAAYFNPRPINVAKMELRGKNGTLTVFVELRDVNYPGSTYTLQYDPASDRLKGAYFQAVEGRTYNIEFLRARS